MHPPLKEAFVVSNTTGRTRLPQQATDFSKTAMKGQLRAQDPCHMGRFLPIPAVSDGILFALLSARLTGRRAVRLAGRAEVAPGLAGYRLPTQPG